MSKKEHIDVSTNEIFSALMKLTDCLENLDIELKIAKITLEDVSVTR